MKKDTLMGVWQHLMNAEALGNGALIALQKKDMPSQEEAAEIARVGGSVAKISRIRRDWEYWFVKPEDIKGDFDLHKGLLPFEKTWYTE